MHNQVIEKIISKSLPYEEADFLNIFGRFKSQVVNSNLSVVLFGAGSAGKELAPIFRMHGINIVCFGDNNSSRIGKTYCELPVVSASELRQKYNDSLIVITTSAYCEEIKQQLIGIGYCEEKIITIPNKEALSYYSHLAQWYWSDEDLNSHKTELQMVYNALSDQKSKDIFVSRIALFVRGADYESFINFITNYSDVKHDKGTNFLESINSNNGVSEAYLQFNNDLLTLNNEEVLVDGGAYTGDSTLEFITACKNNNLIYNKIICYEPEAKIFAELKINTLLYENIVFRPFGLWSRPTTLKFADSSIFKPGSTKIVSEYNDSLNINEETMGVIQILTTSIDSDLPDESVTIIKMDIEGAEMEALRGAMQTITKCKPKLIISAYHKRDDLFEIPLLIHQMVPEYKIYYRHFSRNFGETTLFAIP